VIAATQGWVNDAATSTTDLTFTVPAGDNRLLVFAWSMDADRTLESVTWDAGGADQSLVEAVTHVHSQDNCKAAFWYLAAPTVGSDLTLQVVHAGGSSQWVAHAWILTGADPGQPLTASGEASSQNGISNAIDTTGFTNVMLLDCAADTLQESASTYAPVEINQTEDYEASSNNGEAAFSHRPVATAGVHSMTWSKTNTPSNLVHAIIGVKPA
jgi:hypothetical protein